MAKTLSILHSILLVALGVLLAALGFLVWRLFTAEQEAPRYSNARFVRAPIIREEARDGRG